MSGGRKYRGRVAPSARPTPRPLHPTVYAVLAVVAVAALAIIVPVV